MKPVNTKVYFMLYMYRKLVSVLNKDSGY